MENRVKEISKNGKNRSKKTFYEFIKMTLKNLDVFSCDVLVIGGGGAGLRAAIEAKERSVDVIVVSKSRVGFGNNTCISKGTLAVATGLGDSSDNPDVHTKDTIIGGRFINNQRLVKLVSCHTCNVG